MSGTIVVNQDVSLDVRTIDFLTIANALRDRTGQLELVRKVLESVDEFGMNMICADELDAHEFRSLALIMKEVRAELGGTDPGLGAFLDTVCERMALDARLAGSGSHHG